MEKEINLALHADCTGCRACHDACPTSSIFFQLQGLHYYPQINENTCIACGKCMKACSPIQWEHKKTESATFTPQYYCAWNEDSAERLNATSGGVGGALAKYALDLGWYVCGASFNGDWELSHIVSNEYSILGQIRGSKYLQSDTSGVYKEIVNLLSKGEQVLFLGTPCQADGLRNIVPNKYIESLLTCEIICHGVNSPVVWKDYKEFIEHDRGSKIIKYNFRSKSKGWGKLRVNYQFANGKKVDVPAYRNIFHYWFGQHYMMRESCFRCKYRTEERYSDIIIGDFWGINIIEPTLNVKDGASVVIGNSSRALDFIKGANLLLKEIEKSKANSVLKGFVDKMPEEEKNRQLQRMKQFEKEYESYSFEKMANELYPCTTFFQKYFNSILYHLLKHMTKF